MIHIIAAVAENNAIGKDNQLLWHLPDDLKRFKNLTLNHPIIMGRKTFESFGGKPLPKRHHIIISSQNNENAEQITWVKGIKEAIDVAKSMDETIFIIGGGTIYEQSIHLAERLDLTIIHKSFEADTFFPQIPKKFRCVENYQVSNENLKFAYSYRTYVIG